MNKKIQWLAALSFSLCLAACEQQTVPADTSAPAQPASGPMPAETADTLNCKIELLNGAALVDGAQIPPIQLPGKLELSGWVILDHANRAPEAVSVEFVDSNKPGAVAHAAQAGQRAERPDVDQAFSAPPGSKPGFVVAEASVELPAGTYQVQVVGKDSGNRYACPHAAQVRVEAAH